MRHTTNLTIKLIFSNFLVNFSLLNAQRSATSILCNPARVIVELKPGNLPKILEKYGKIEHEYSLLFNGVSITLNDNATEMDLMNVAGVEQVWPVIKYIKPKTITQPFIYQNESLSLETHKMTGVDWVHKNYPEYLGNGVKIGFIDSGIDYTHPAFGGCFGVGCRVRFGYDFADQDPDPMDCNGHGTHVAGIATGKEGAFTGVGPNALIGAYKIFPCDKNNEDHTNSELLVRAMEQAYTDEMDIVNMSVGSGSSWPNTLEARIASLMTNKGIIVVASQGNEGNGGLWQTSSPAISRDVISVASVESPTYVGGFFSISGRRIHYSGVYSRSDSLPMDIQSTTYDLCESQLPFNVTGVLLVKRGRCPVAVKSKNAKRSNASILIVYNHHPEIFKFSVEYDDETVPTLGISGSDGEWIETILSTKKSTVQFDEFDRIFENAEKGQVSDFSSWGLSPDFNLKPDISAPGGFIYSTYTQTYGKYAVLSGTSMASPYIAGCIAVLKSFDKNLTIESIKTLLQITAIPVRTNSSYASISKQGGGLVNLKAAVKTLLSGVDFQDIKPVQTLKPECNQETKTIKINIPHSGQVNIDHVPYQSISMIPNMISVQEIPMAAEIRYLQHGLIEVSIPHTTDPVLFNGAIMVHDSQRRFRYKISYYGMSGNVSLIPVILRNTTEPFVSANDEVFPMELPQQTPLFFPLSLTLNWIPLTPIYNYTLSFHSRNTDERLLIASGRFLPNHDINNPIKSTKIPNLQNKTGFLRLEVHGMPWTCRHEIIDSFEFR